MSAPTPSLCRWGELLGQGSGFGTRSPAVRNRGASGLAYGCAGLKPISAISRSSRCRRATAPIPSRLSSTHPIGAAPVGPTLGHVREDTGDGRGIGDVPLISANLVFAMSFRCRLRPPRIPVEAGDCAIPLSSRERARSDHCADPGTATGDHTLPACGCVASNMLLSPSHPGRLARVSTVTARADARHFSTSLVTADRNDAGWAGERLRPGESGMRTSRVPRRRIPRRGSCHFAMPRAILGTDPARCDLPIHALSGPVRRIGRRRLTGGLVQGDELQRRSSTAASIPAASA